MQTESSKDYPGQRFGRSAHREPRCHRTLPDAPSMLDPVRGPPLACHSEEGSQQMAASYPDVLEPAQLGPLRLRNRVIEAATFEGMATGAVVSDNLVDYHRQVSEGGESA